MGADARARSLSEDCGSVDRVVHRLDESDHDRTLAGNWGDMRHDVMRFDTDNAVNSLLQDISV